MHYWNVKHIVSEYTCPVQMMSQVMAELSAADIFNADRQDIAELEEYCALVHQICRSARLFQNQTIKNALRRL